jgi:hypothetical protein
MSKPHARWSSLYTQLLAMLVVVYVAGYGALLYSTGGLPYVLDNNESFSTLQHAMNLYRFGISKSVGLTDEATGPNPDAHPYVHTHQGNFPRLFGLLIYAFGARSIESQIVVTTFTAGILVVLMAYHVFARLAGPLLAFVASVALLSDYMHVAQWQVNTYRIWHFFLVFSSLACAYGLGGRRRPLWLGLTFVNAVALFYCELVSVAFTSLLTGLFVISLYWRQPRRVIEWTIAHTAGGLSALALLIVQLVAYLGWDTFLLDIWLTYNARNFGTADGPLREQVTKFYQENNILFWQNFVDGEVLKSFAAFLDIHTRFVFQIYTPILTLVVLIVTAGWFLGLSWWYDRIWRVRRPGRADSHRAILRVRVAKLYAIGSLEIGLSDLPPVERKWLRIANQIFRLSLLFLPMTITLLMVIQGESIAGVSSLPTSGLSFLLNVFVAIVAGAGASLVLMKARTGSWLAPTQLPLWRLCMVATLLLLVSLVIAQQPGGYDQAYRSIWYDPIVAIIPLWVDRIALLLALGFAVSMCLFGTQRVLGQVWTSRLGGLGIYLLCAGVAYVLTFNLAAGYVSSGYVRRTAPLPVFLFGVLVAFAVCIVVAGAARAWTTRLRGASCPRTTIWCSRSALGATAGLLITWMAGYWVVVNGTYVAMIPPTQFVAMLKQFASPPLHGKSAVVNNYGLPVAVQSDNWTYYDQEYGTENNVRQGQAGFEPVADPTSHIWLADKLDNPAYLRPDTFVCMRARNFDTYSLRPPPVRDFDPNDCAALPLIERIERKRQRIVEHKLIDRDHNTPSTWAIVQLDWDFPPYLDRLDNGQSNEVVRLVLTSGSDNVTVQVQYQYAQQDGSPERQSVVRLHAVGGDGKWCVYERSSNRNTFTLPADFRGQLRASVTPRSQTKSGQETFGKTLTIGDGQGTPCQGKE